ncbi:MAG: O-antigen ligase family protein [bacterium]|nr:O-antigen ligase family protein [bacterium]
MNSSFNGVKNTSEDIWESGIVLLTGVGIGALTSQYSLPLTFIATIAFAFGSIALYASSWSRPQSSIESAALSHDSTKNTFLFSLFHLSFFLSITIPKSGRTISGIPITTANLCILLTLLLWVLKFIFSQTRHEKIYLSKAFIIFIFYGVIASVLGFMKGNNYKFIVLDFVVFIGFIPAYFLVCSVVNCKKHIRQIMLTIVIGMGIVCLYGALQPKLGFEEIAISGLTRQYNMATYEGVGKWNVIEGGGQKVYSTFQNGNIFGNHLALFIPLLGGLLLGLPSLSSRKNFFLIGTFLLACYTLLITYSRGALISTAGGIIFLTFLSKKIRLKAIVIMSVVLIIFMVFIQYYSERPELTRYDFRRVADDPNSFSAGRVFRVKFVLNQFSNYPVSEKLFGRGFGSGLVVQHRNDYTDNLYLTLLFKSGILGVLLLFCLLALLFKRLISLYGMTTDKQLQGVIAGGMAGMVAALIHYLADTLWLFPPLAVNFWFLAGISMMAGVIGSQDITPQEQVPVTSRGTF